MYPAPFELHQPKSVDEALALLSQLGDNAKLLAGGHSLLPTMKLRLATPDHLIDLSAIQILAEIQEEKEFLSIGAMATHWAVQSSPIVQRLVPFMSQVAGGIADAQVRNRGTIAGSLVHADPAADYPAALLAAGAQVVCVGNEGERTIPIDDWFVAMMTTALQEGEMVTRLRIPKAGRGSAGAYVKHKHPASRFAMPGVAVSLTLDGKERCTKVRIGITGAAAVPSRATRVESQLIDRDASAIGDAAQHADDDLEVDPGFQLSQDDKRQLLRVTTRKALEAAWATARFAPR